MSVVLFRYHPTSTAVYLFSYIAPSSTSIITPLKSSLSPPLYLIIYIDKPVSDVIKDILDKCGNGYNFDFVPDGMRIYLCNDKVVEPKFRISPNTELKNSVQYMGNIEHKGSIENMKNSVKVITDTDVMTTLKAEESISKYGFLQEVVKMNDGNNASDLAKKNLGELNKEDETYSGSCIACQHSIKNGVHYNKIDMERLV